MAKLPKGSGKKMTKTEKSEALARWSKQYLKDGWSLRQIAAEAGRSYGLIHKTLSDGGIELRSRGGKPLS